MTIVSAVFVDAAGKPVGGSVQYKAAAYKSENGFLITPAWRSAKVSSENGLLAFEVEPGEVDLWLRLDGHTDVMRVVVPDAYNVDIGEIAVKDGSWAPVTEGELRDSLTEFRKLQEIVDVNNGKLPITLRDSAVTEPKLADMSVSRRTIQAGAVTGDHIAPYAVTSTKLGTGSVINAKLGRSSVTSDKLADGAVTADKLASNALYEVVSAKPSTMVPGKIYIEI